MAINANPDQIGLCRVPNTVPPNAGYPNLREAAERISAHRRQWSLLERRDAQFGAEMPPPL